MNRMLLVELKRPTFVRLLTVYACLVTMLFVVVFTLLLPARETALAQQHMRDAAAQENALHERLAEFLPQAQALDQALPDLLQKIEWDGPMTAYSSAVQDAASLAGITILEETNEIERSHERVIYRKSLGLQASYSQLLAFLEHLEHVELLVVPSAISIDAGTPLTVSLQLTTFGGSAR